MCPSRILFLTTNPINLDPLRIDKEIRAMREFTNTIEIEPWLNQNDLIRLLQNAVADPPNIIHFSGHDLEEGICLENPLGSGHILENNDLITLFKALRGRVECVILNSCRSRYQARMLANYINFVVGFSDDITDQDSIKFSEQFYNCIAHNMDFKTAASSAFGNLASRNNGIFYYRGIPGFYALRDAPLSRIRDFIQIRYINTEFHFVQDISDEILEKYSQLFSHISEEGNGKTTNIIDLSNFILESESPYPFKINGFSGAGKSIFLTLLYLCMCNKCDNAQNALTIIPIYIDLHYYLRHFSESKDENPVQLQADLNEDWEYLKQLMSNLSGDFTYIFIINGLEEYNHTGFHFDENVQNFFDYCSRNLIRYRKVIGISTQKQDYLYWNQGRVSYDFLGQSSRSIELKSIAVTDKNFDKFIELFCDVTRPSNTNTRQPDSLSEDLKKQIKKYNLNEVDFFILRLLLHNQSKWNNKNLSQFYLSCCNDKLEPNQIGETQDREIYEAAKLSFRCVIKNEEINFNEKKKSWFLIHSHNTFRNFLLAHYIVETLKGIRGNESPDQISEITENFNYIYPNDINIFLKELVNLNPFTQRAIYNAIDRINNIIVGRRKIQLCLYYILGRFTDNQIKIRAQNLLLHQKNQEMAAIDNETNREDILLLRTIYMSLIYLGHTASLREYLKKLIEDPLWENVNRGFHLEYYGDICFDVNQSLLNRDDLNKDFPLTYFKLYSSLDKAIGAERFHVLFDIELYTLCSLAQHRHIIGKLDEQKRKCIIELTGQALHIFERNINCNQELYQYVLMINYILKVPKLSLDFYIKKFFKIKSLKRQGWVKRGIKNPESVADHMYGAYLIGLIYLPNNLNNKDGYQDYDKEKILKMLLIHDLAVVHISDSLPGQRRRYPNIERNEKKWFKIISMLDTFSAMGTTRYIYEYWREFQENVTINARIAKDIDKLENLLQLHLYKNLLSPNDFEDFRNDLLPLIITEEGRNIRNIIEGNAADLYIGQNRNH